MHFLCSSASNNLSISRSGIIIQLYKFESLCSPLPNVLECHFLSPSSTLGPPFYAPVCVLFYIFPSSYFYCCHLNSASSHPASLSNLPPKYFTSSCLVFLPKALPLYPIPKFVMAHHAQPTPHKCSSLAISTASVWWIHLILHITFLKKESHF